MVYRETVSDATFTLIRELLTKPYLQDFFLVGGTALALQIGHRQSIDIDLFSQKPFAEDTLQQHLQRDFSFQLDFADQNTLKTTIRKVKTDFLTHAYPVVYPLINESGVRMASAADIGAMKLNAIINSGERLKDFVDIYFLLETMPLQTIIDAFAGKYPQGNPLLAMKALTYLQDIRPEPIQWVGEPVSIAALDQRLQQATRNLSQQWTS